VRPVETVSLIRGKNRRCGIILVSGRHIISAHHAVHVLKMRKTKEAVLCNRINGTTDSETAGL
jgi:hypothetical protein